jgi:hypothetical protein
LSGGVRTRENNGYKAMNSVRVDLADGMRPCTIISR